MRPNACSTSFKKGFNALLKECGFIYENVEDKHSVTLLRHTYATFALTRPDVKRASMGALAKQMGTSERMIQQHYWHDELVARKEHRVLQETGRLSCEVCGFNFTDAYEDRGDGFIECHHTKPVSELRDGEKTNTNDLALVCSNCHRMINRRKPWLSVAALSALLAG